MTTRWFVEIVIAMCGLLSVAACATGTSFGDGGGDNNGGSGGTIDITGVSSSASSASSSSGVGGAGGGSSSSSGVGGGVGGGGGSTSSSSSASSSSSSSGGTCAMPCELVSPQCGCMAGKACVIDGDGMRLCVTAGSGAVGTECTSSADCVAGTYCLGTSANDRTCHAFCSSDALCTAPGGLCAITLNDMSGTTIPNVKLCSENCDLSTNMGCTLAGTGCRFGQETTGAKRLFTLCGAAGTGVNGSSCASDASCSGGHGCFGGTCRKYCKMGGTACPNGSCNPFFIQPNNTPPTIGNTTYGICP